MKKIMFSDLYGLTQAVLDGRKTQTRRIIKFSPIDAKYVNEEGWSIGGYVDSEIINHYSRFKVGEVAAVAQSYKDIVEHLAKKGWDIARWLDKHGVTKNMAGWLNKMFVKAGLMIHYIRITAVRVERLNDISESDCIAEGIYLHTDGYYSFPNSKMGYDTPREAYAALIDRISGKGTWESNPYVFAYTFELMK